MDDKEYYSLTNRRSSWAVRQALRQQGNPDEKSAGDAVSALQSYKNLEVRQGRADAEMLTEKSERFSG